MTEPQRRQEVISCAEEIVSLCEEGTSLSHVLLRKCDRLCALTQMKELRIWIQWEQQGLEGDWYDRALATGDSVVRSVADRLYRTRRIKHPESEEEAILLKGAAELEHIYGQLLSSGNPNEVWRGVGRVQLALVIERIKNEISTVTSDILVSHKFGDVAQEIFDQAQKIIELSESRRASLPDLLRKCHRLGRLSRRQDITLWALCEQDGVDPRGVLPIEAYDGEDRRLAYERYARTRTAGEPNDKEGLFRASIHELIHNSQVNNMEASEAGAYEMVFDEDIVLERIGNEIYAVACDILSTYEHRYELEDAVKQEEDRLTDQETAELPEEMLPDEFSLRSESDSKGKRVQWAYVLTCFFALVCAVMAVVAFITQRPVTGGVLLLLVLALVAITWPWLKRVKLTKDGIEFDKE